MLKDPQVIATKLRQLQRLIRSAVVRAQESTGLHQVRRVSTADTIYQLDFVIEPIIVSFCNEWGQLSPMVVVAEGIEPETGRVFPAGASEQDARLRIILDPVDGTRGLMYDKRPAWSLAAAAPNRGPRTRLRDIEVAVMTELPTRKMGRADSLWALRGQGVVGQREDLITSQTWPLPIRPSTSDSIAHGFAMVSNFFPATKVLASELMEFLVRHLLGEVDASKAMVFEDQYISTGGQFYELVVGHDRFNADLRGLFYRIQNRQHGLCVHPYDACCALIATEAGVMLTDGVGNPLDGPLDCTTSLSWCGYANTKLHDTIQPLVSQFLRERGIE